MIPVPSGVRIWIATGHTDMRRGMQGLALQVQEGLGRDTFLCFGRDYLLATTGIRNGELRALQLQDIDWRAGEIFVRRTKGKRDRVAPLVDETGAALADYILRARPRVDSPYVFLSLAPPVGPFKFAASISRMGRKRLQCGG
jgi:integrase